MWRILIISLCLLLVLAPFHFRRRPDPDASILPITIQQVQDDGAIVYDRICTGAVIHSGIGLLLTAKHCTRTDSPLFVNVEADHPLPATPMWMSSDIDDVAVLFVEGLNAPALSLASHEPLPDDAITVHGYPDGLALQHLRGYVASLNTPVVDESTDYGTKMMFDATICGGSSGSPVLNSHHEIVSVMQIGIERRLCSKVSGGIRYARLAELTQRFFGY